MRQRRALDTTSPGNAALRSLLTPHGLLSIQQQQGGGGGGSGAAPVVAVQTADCSAARALSAANHDYGRYDGFALIEQHDSLAAVPPQDRLLEARLGGLWRL